MVKVIESEQSHWSLPRVRLEARELVAIVESCAEVDETVTAEVGKYRFNGIDDLKKNPSMLAGCPIIFIGNAKIRLDHSILRGVSHWGYGGSTGLQRTKIIAANIESNLIEYKTFFRTNFFKWILSVSISIFSLLIILLKDFELEKWEFYFYPIVVFCLIFSFLDRLVETDTVYFKNQASFWARNKDKIIVGLLMLIFGSIVTWAVPKL